MFEGWQIALLLATAAHGVSLERPCVFVAMLAPTAAVGAFIGSHLTHRVPRTWVRLVFIVFLAWTAYKMLTV